MKARFWVALPAIAAVAFACGPSTQPAGDAATPATGEPKYGGTLTVHGVSDPFNWAPTETKGTPHDGSKADYTMVWIDR